VARESGFAADPVASVGAVGAAEIDGGIEGHGVGVAVPIAPACSGTSRVPPRHATKAATATTIGRRTGTVPHHERERKTAIGTGREFFETRTELHAQQIERYPAGRRLLEFNLNTLNTNIDRFWFIPV
jgi:hypothetical protein